MTTRILRGALVLVLALALGACSMTRLKTTWTAPGVERIHFRKIVVFVIANDEALRRNAEQALCAQITRVPCVPAFAVVADEARGDIERVARRVDAEGFDGAVVLRYSGERVQQTYVRTAPLWGYYGSGWGGAYGPGYVRQDQMVDIETTVYSVPDRKLLWAGTTESLNPDDVDRTVREIVEAVARAMRKQGLIPPD